VLREDLEAVVTAFPRLSPDAAHVTSGWGTVEIDGRPIAPGQGSCWFNREQIVYGDPQGCPWLYGGGTQLKLASVGYNDLVAGGGRWAGGIVNSAVVRIDRSDGPSIERAYQPAMSDAGDLAYLTAPTSPEHELRCIRAGGTRADLITAGPIEYPSVCSAGIVWSSFASGIQRTWACPTGDTPREVHASFCRWEVRPIAVDVGGALWVCSVDETRVLLYPAGSTFGYVVIEGSVGEANSKDVRYDLTRRAFRCVYTQGEQLIWIDAFRVDLSKPPNVDPPQPEPIVPLPAGTVIADTLPYVIGTPAAWPRVGDEGGNMDCVPVAGQAAVAFVKFASPSFAEWWRWDGDYIYHHEDRSDGLDQPYHWTKDRWIKRRWAIGEQIDSRENNVIRRTADEGDNWSERPWAMVMRFVAAFESYPCGGDIGDAPVIVVEYDPTYTLEPRRGGVERFWFAAGWGWFRWQSAPFGTVFDFSPDPSTPNLTDAFFHRLGGVRVTPIDPVRPWAAPPVEPPPEEPMKPRDQFYREFQDVNAFYQADEGLKRPGGMMLNDPSRCDVEAMGAWGYDLAAGKTVNDCKNAIVRSDEWATKHPGEVPPTFP